MNSEAAGNAGPSQEDVFTVRVPRDRKKKFTIMKFGSGGVGLDFSKMGDTSIKIERENNLREYKTANDLDLLPKFGAGSEYGRDQKEESRRKKYGIMLKKYNPNDQPWHLKLGQGKQAKRYKGVREGTIAENTSYFIFTKAADGAFEAFPVDEWYNFNPIIKYKYLTSEEAEEEFNRRDMRLNYFNIMARKRTKKEEDGADGDDDEEGKGSKKFKKKKKEKDLILTDLEEWNDFDMSDDDGDSDDEEKEDDDDKPKKKNKGKADGKKKVKNSKKNSDDEAVEESDEGDYDDREVDYMSSSGDSSSLSGGEEQEKKDNKYEEKGVDEEDGLRKILDSEAEDEEQEEADKDEEDLDEKEDKKEEKKKGENDSSSSSSEDDSDIEKEASALFSKVSKSDKKKDGDVDNTDAIPSSSEDKSKVAKRKLEKSGETKSPSAKKHRKDDDEGITEDAIRRYLMRKPMTTRDLLQKFKSKKLNMSKEAKEERTRVIAQLLKKINPEKKTINRTLYLSLKKPE